MAVLPSNARTRSRAPRMEACRLRLYWCEVSVALTVVCVTRTAVPRLACSSALSVSPTNLPEHTIAQSVAGGHTEHYWLIYHHFLCRCVLKMDHHCPWVNTCVGHHNQPPFVKFLFFLSIGCVHAILINSKFLYHLFSMVLHLFTLPVLSDHYTALPRTSTTNSTYPSLAGGS